jgi:hypothetical protein
MRKIVDEIILHPVKLHGFLAENENDENAQLYNPDQYAQDKDHHPRVGGKHLVLLQIEPFHGRTKTAAHPDIPVNIKKEGGHQGDHGENKHQYGMKKPLHLFHGGGISC